MVGKKFGKGKPGGPSMAVVLGKKGDEELGDSGQGGSGAKGEDGELVLDADASLVMEMSAEKKAVEKATGSSGQYRRESGSGESSSGGTGFGGGVIIGRLPRSSTWAA